MPRRLATSPCPDDVTAGMIDSVRRICRSNSDTPGSLIPVLQRAQGICGYLPVYVQDVIADELLLPRADVYGVVTFYSFFSMVPRGRHLVKVCMGTACFVRGSQGALNRIEGHLGVGVGQTTDDRRYTLEAVRCLGACGLAPVTVINEDTHRQLTSDKAVDILEHYE